MCNEMIPCFAEIRRTAANVPQPGESGNYTAGMFLEDFPQFTLPDEGEGLVPKTMLEVFIAQANDSVLPSRWGSLWRAAAGLYVAHFSAMYLQTYAPSSANAAQAAQAARQPGAVKSVVMGDTSISYDNAAVTSGTEKWGAWNATLYGQQLVTYARQVGMGGMWVG